MSNSATVARTKRRAVSTAVTAPPSPGKTKPGLDSSEINVKSSCILEIKPTQIPTAVGKRLHALARLKKDESYARALAAVEGSDDHRVLTSIFALIDKLDHNRGCCTVSVDEFVHSPAHDVITTYTPDDLSYLFSHYAGYVFCDAEDMKKFSKRTNAILSIWGKVLASPHLDEYGKLAINGTLESKSFKLDIKMGNRRIQKSLKARVRTLPDGIVLHDESPSLADVP